MKKLIFAIALLSATFGNAQGFKFGGKAGLNLSSLNTSSSVGDTKMLTGFHVGGLVEYKFNEKMGLQSELLYSQEGGKYSFEDVVGTVSLMYDQEIKLSKINLPISFKYWVVKNLALEIGPQFSYIVKADSESEISIPTAFTTITQNSNFDSSSSVVLQNSPFGTNSLIVYQDNGLQKLNLSANIGASYDFNFGMFVQARYNYGFTNFVKDSNFLAARDIDGDKLLAGSPVANKYDNISFKNSNLQFSVGYKF